MCPAKKDKDVEDPRSTMRRRARAVLEEIDRPYFCGSTSTGSFDMPKPEGYDPSGRPYPCGRSPILASAPGGLFAAMGALQANHINKNIMDNDPANLQWLCASCHKEKDSQSEVGVSVIKDEFGYGELL